MLSAWSVCTIPQFERSDNCSVATVHVKTLSDAALKERKLMEVVMKVETAKPFVSFLILKICFLCAVICLLFVCVQPCGCSSSFPLLPPPLSKKGEKMEEWKRESPSDSVPSKSKQNMKKLLPSKMEGGIILLSQCQLKERTYPSPRANVMFCEQKRCMLYEQKYLTSSSHL